MELQTLLLNSTYEPIAFISFEKMIKLLIKNKAERVSSWNQAMKHFSGYDPVCGSNLKFYNSLIHINHLDMNYSFCSQECADIFEISPSEFLHPSILRLKKYAPRHIKKIRYNRCGVFKRDGNICQYCCRLCKNSELTIDHVIPRCMGGATSWNNCVTCCYSCNNKKADRTPKMAGMKLLHRPSLLTFGIWQEYNTKKIKHKDWIIYICK
ncbi:MAG: HNH endonuclease [bacterium]|nr:HNH endonuclease [bacterium]